VVITHGAGPPDEEHTAREQADPSAREAESLAARKARSMISNGRRLAVPLALSFAAIRQRAIFARLMNTTPSPHYLRLRGTDLQREDWPPICVLTGGEGDTQVMPFVLRSVPWYVYLVAFVPVLFLPAYLLSLRREVVSLPVREDRWRRVQWIARLRLWLFVALIGVVPTALTIFLWGLEAAPPESCCLPVAFPCCRSS